MSKKDKILDVLKSWHSYRDKAINAFMALIAFTFTAAGGVISAPSWLVILSAVATFFSGIALIYIQKKIAKLQKELGEMK